MWVTASSRARRLVLVGWAVFAAVNAWLMWTFPGVESIPFHFVWISIALVFGATTWPLLSMMTALAAVALATGAILAHHALIGEIHLEETAEVPLMAGIFLVMVWHVRRRQLAMTALERVAEQERQRAENQQLFVRLASHELRTPITVARGYLELIREAHPDAQTDEDTAIALSELAKLDRLTARLSTLMQLEEKQPTHTMDLDQLVRRTVHRWSGVADRKWLAASTAGIIVADEERLQAAVDSLIENAVRFTGDGDAVELHAWRERDYAVIEVRDRGVGIAEADQQRIFERFWSRGPDGTRSGTGLGLAIAKAAVEARDGTLAVRSRPGGGTTFTIRLPNYAMPDPLPSSDLVITG